MTPNLLSSAIPAATKNTEVLQRAVMESFLSDSLVVVTLRAGSDMSTYAVCNGVTMPYSFFASCVMGRLLLHGYHADDPNPADPSSDTNSILESLWKTAPIPSLLSTETREARYLANLMVINLYNEKVPKGEGGTLDDVQKLVNMIEELHADSLQDPFEVDELP